MQTVPRDRHRKIPRSIIIEASPETRYAMAKQNRYVIVLIRHFMTSHVHACLF